MTAAEALGLVGRSDVVLWICASGRNVTGTAAFRVRHAPYPDLRENIAPGGVLHELSAATGSSCCSSARWERSAMAVRGAGCGLEATRHIHGGMDAWKKCAG